MSIKRAKALARIAGILPEPRRSHEDAPHGLRSFAEDYYASEDGKATEERLWAEYSKRRKKRYSQLQRGLMANNAPWTSRQVAYTWRSPEGKVFKSWLHRRKFRFATPKAVWGYLKSKYPGLDPTPVGNESTVRLQVGSRIDMETGEVVGLGYTTFQVWEWVMAPKIPKWQYAAEAAYVQRGAWPDTAELKDAYDAHLKGEITEVAFSERVRRILAVADEDLDPVERSFVKAWEHLEDRPGKEPLTLEAREAEFHNNPNREHIEVERLLNRNFSVIEELGAFIKFVDDHPPKINRSRKSIPVDLSDLL